MCESLYFMVSLILTQYRVLRIGIIWGNLGALTTVCTRESVEGDLFETLEDCSTESYSSEV